MPAPPTRAQALMLVLPLSSKAPPMPARRAEHSLATPGELDLKQASSRCARWTSHAPRRRSDRGRLGGPKTKGIVRLGVSVPR